MKSAEQKAKKVPTIRFAGFDDEWVEKKLGEMASFSKGMGYSKGDLKENGTPIVLYGRLYTKYETIISDVDTFADAKSNSVYSKGGEVIVPGSGETAEDISIASVVKKSGVLLGGDLNVITPPKNLDSVFLAISISNGKPHSDMAKMAQGKSVVHLHNTDLAEINLPYPNIIEQQKLGSFFSNIDSLISLEQKKYDKLTQVKKSMLEKMFPKEGATVPEIRFAGFTGDWEEKKLGDTVLLRGRIGFRGYKETDLVPKGMGAITFSPADIDETGFISLENNKYLSWQKYDESPEIQVKVGDILFTKTASIGKVGYVQLLSNKATINPQFALLSPNENMNGYFIFLSVRNDSFMKKVKGITGGSSVPTMSQEKLKELTFLKTSIDEQNKIGSYFSHLDSLISLQQRKLEKLKNIKKSLLEKMFV